MLTKAIRHTMLLAFPPWHCSGFKGVSLRLEVFSFWGFLENCAPLAWGTWGAHRAGVWVKEIAWSRGGPVVPAAQPRRGALRGHASLTCVWFCVMVLFALSQAAAMLRAARTKILKAVFLSSGWGEVDILFFPTGFFVCAFSRWCAPERSCALGTVHMRIRSPVWHGSEGSLPGRGI